MDKADRMIIGENIDKIRVARGMSKKQLADAAGYSSVTTVYRQINTSEMRIDDIFRYAKALGVEPSELLKRDLKMSEFEIPFDITSLYPYNLAFEVEKYHAWGNHGYLKSFIKTPDEEILNKEARESLYEVHIPSFEKLIESDIFTKRDKEIIEMRWKHSMTLKDISKHFGLTQERIRQLELRTKRKLSYRRRHYIMVLPKEVNELREKATKLENSIVDHGKRLKEAIDEERILIRTPIENLELSVRSFNCLRRKGYHYVDELVNIPLTDIANIRNMGRRSLNEVLSKLENYGIGVEERENGELFTTSIMQ